MDTKIHTRIWADPAFIELTDSEKLGIFWALTNTNSCGYVSTSPKKLRRDVETSAEELKSAMKQFGKDVHVFDDGLWFEGYMREQLGKTADKLRSSKMFSTVLMHLKELCPPEVQELIYVKYPEVKEGASEGDGKGHAKGEGEGVGESKGVGISKGVEVGMRSIGKEMEEDGEKAGEAVEEMEMEVAMANNQSPSASCYTEYD
jgi:hypothetical protein